MDWDMRHGCGTALRAPFIEVVMSLKIAQSEWFRETFNQVNQILDLLNPCIFEVGFSRWY